METWDAIRGRRAVREFADRPLQDAHLERILDAGRRAPSSKNRQRWGFVVVRDRQRLRALALTGPFAQHVATAAAAIALVAPDAGADVDVRSIMLDLGHVAQNMMLAAWDVGIGSVHARIEDQAAIREILGFPSDMRCDYVFSFGDPTDRSVLSAPRRPGGRRPLTDVVHDERW